MAKPKYKTEQDEIIFNVLNKNTVDILRKQGEVKLPPKKMDIPKDKRWNAKILNSMLLQGIEQGLSMKDIAKSIFPEMMSKEDLRGKSREEIAGIIHKNKVSAIRNARTMVTNAENQGRLDSYENLAEQGVVQKKVWIATPDDRTRASHLEIDGEEVDIEDEFSNGCQCPGDPNGPPEEVWNCRCSMRSHIIGFRKPDGSIREVGKPRDDTMHSKQMQEEKERRGLKEEKISIGITGDVYTDEQREKLTDLLKDNDSISAQLYLENADALKEINPDVDASVGTAYFDPTDGMVHLNPADVAQDRPFKPAFATHFHEYGHNIDYINGELDWGTGVKSYASQLYRDENRRTFGEVITAEWEEQLQTRAMWANFESNLDISGGGIGAESWLKTGLQDWRRENGINRDNSRYTSLREEIENIITVDDARNFIQKNIDIYDNKSYYITGSTINRFCEEVKRDYSMEARTDISDMFELFSINHGGPERPFGIGHGRDYAKREGNLEVETFAEMFSAEIANSESLEAIKHFLPKSYEAYKNICRGIKK